MFVVSVTDFHQLPHLKRSMTIQHPCISNLTKLMESDPSRLNGFTDPALRELKQRSEQIRHQMIELTFRLEHQRHVLRDIYHHRDGLDT